ncbi:MAG: tRNA pseudouridine(38-40) synthase TruA [archaeon]|nr:tRNA pseudouridine(38-40) synthase TruA [archaeon]
MRRVAVKIAYLGEDYSGSQYQPDFKTVVGDVIADLKRISEGKAAKWFNIKIAGRTDKGVNALNNVVVFNTTFDNDDTLLKALNSVSRRIFYRMIATVDEKFNPRHASERVYKYTLPSEGVDFTKIKECTKLFIDEHDFIRFCKNDGKSTIVKLSSIETVFEDDKIIIMFRSQYFLRNMIRKIVAAILAVGKGERTINDIKEALNGKPINFGLARADALTLVDVIYDYIRFKIPSKNYYNNRINQERFSNCLKTDFFDSL